MTTARHALVVGASGIVGGALAAELSARPGWRVTGVSRRGREATGWRRLPLDLTAAAACREAARELTDVTHFFFCARYSDRDPVREAHVNRAMLTNLLEPLAAGAAGLTHVSLVHGTKWYGSHLGPYKTPARESDPRHEGPNFYFDQLDAVAALRRGASWTWSTVRPHIVCAPTTGYPFNLVTLLGAYGSLCAARGLPFDFPGTEACFHSVSQATDASLLARAMVWAATEPECADQSFNIIDGDYFRWSGIWPRLADFFGVMRGEVRPTRLSAEMADAEAEWGALVEARGLTPLPVTALANWRFGDFLFRADWDDMSSMLKARRYGFHEALDTEESILGSLAELRRRRVIP
ncbi:SDR family oxidoreductase [Pikeienuella piscinae]|uniref:SDR family oxidoreductase n=1 Tax=Pikeienuella piscinae TaxID=2748098 RepID=A0A7L5BWC8_9RHOB|nr:SDR family oxidoreductase [Pikeienuella piscinae]QIE56710.1 SDR family oxidoreductase [Pikeienuella piscinae]